MLPNEDSPISLIAYGETPKTFEDIYISGRSIRFVEPIENRMNALQVLENYVRDFVFCLLLHFYCYPVLFFCFFLMPGTF
jgi:hypothetical protein